MLSEDSLYMCSFFSYLWSYIYYLDYERIRVSQISIILYYFILYFVILNKRIIIFTDLVNKISKLITLSKKHAVDLLC